MNSWYLVNLALWLMIPTSTACCSTWTLEGAYFRALNGAVIDVCTAQIPEWEAKYVWPVKHRSSTHTKNILFSHCLPWVVGLYTRNVFLFPFLYWNRLLFPWSYSVNSCKLCTMSSIETACRVTVARSKRLSKRYQNQIVLLVVVNDHTCCEIHACIFLRTAKYYHIIAL